MTKTEKTNAPRGGGAVHFCAKYLRGDGGADKMDPFNKLRSTK